MQEEKFEAGAGRAGGDRLAGRTGWEQPPLFLWRAPFAKCPMSHGWKVGAGECSELALAQVRPSQLQGGGGRSGAWALSNVGLCGGRAGAHHLSTAPRQIFLCGWTGC